MKKFLVLYMAPSEEFSKLMSSMTPEQQKAGMDEWEKWMDEHKSDLVDWGAPVGKTKRVTSKGAENVKNEVGGYSIVRADSHEAAAKLFENNPHFQIPGSWIEVMECMGMPGM